MEKPFAIFASFELGVYLETYSTLKTLRQAIRRNPDKYPENIVLHLNHGIFEPIIFTSPAYISASTCSLRVRELQTKYEVLKKKYYNTHQINLRRLK